MNRIVKIRVFDLVTWGVVITLAIALIIVQLRHIGRLVDNNNNCVAIVKEQLGIFDI